ncbi:MAG: type II toxin-antitoxin system prevent-host-death family antitoxin [Anaerolineae bacterium]|jgi:antitoxin YefM
METISVNQAKTNFQEVVQRVLDDVTPTIVMTESGESIVMLTLDEYNAWQETLYLLSTPANAEHLRQSIAEDQAGYAAEQNLIEP